jgi:hypothetical protein
MLTYADVCCATHLYVVYLEDVVDVDFRMHPGRRCRSETIMTWEIEYGKNTSPPGDVMMIYSEM